MLDKPKRKKMSKQQRERARVKHVTTWTDGFKYGYDLGHEQGRKEALKGIEGLLSWEVTKGE